MPRSFMPTLAVFASDKGPGDPERASIMTQAGSFLGRKGARIVCLAEGGALPVPLITAARAVGGEVHIIADAGSILPPAFAGVLPEVIEDERERMLQLARLSNAFVVLPGSLASTTRLFSTWTTAKTASITRPVVMLNHHRAFEVMRGYAADVLSHGLKNYDHAVQFADNLDDLWSRVSRLVSEQGR